MREVWPTGDLAHFRGYKKPGFPDPKKVERATRRSEKHLNKVRNCPFLGLIYRLKRPSIALTVEALRVVKEGRGRNGLLRAWRTLLRATMSESDDLVQHIAKMRYISSKFTGFFQEEYMPSYAVFWVSLSVAHTLHCVTRFCDPISCVDYIHNSKHFVLIVK